MALRALVLPCIFCLGAAGNFKKKMPLFVAALLTGMLFVLFGGNTVGLFSTLLLGLFLGLIYAKTDSLISAVVFMLCSGIPTLGLYLLRAPFGIETTITYTGYSGYEFTCFGFYYLANNISLFAQFALVYLLLTLLASIVLLLVGIILLISIGKGKKKAETEEQKQEEEADSVVYVNDDPFAGI
jgi:predicted membrane protein